MTPAPAPAAGAVVNTSPNAAAPAPPPRAFLILLDQANYWTAQGRPELAQQALDRLLQLDPNNPDVLAASAEVAAQNGDRPTAETYLARLNQIAPNTPAAMRAAQALRAATVDQAILSDARRLSEAGQREAAMQRYRELFPNGDVPVLFAAEYYLTLAGTSERNFEEARQGLERAVQLAPDNLALQLSYAQLLSFNEGYRIEAVRRLRTLADAPMASAGARATWRQTLLWMGSDPDTAEMIEIYLRTNPADPEIQAKFEEAKATRIPPGAIERLNAWNGLSERRFDDAERGFEAAIASDPTDGEAVFGLAIIRKIQERFPEARELLARAIELSPLRREEFEQQIGDLTARPAIATGGGSRGGGGRGFVAPASAATLAWQNLSRNALDSATRHANQAIRAGGAERAQGETVLGMVAIRQRNYSAAETRFRSALSINPRFAAAQAGLFEVLQRQRRFAEADRLVSETGYRPNQDTLLLRATILREEAARTADPEAKLAILRGALAADPNNVWASYDVARLLRAKGQVEEARRIERSLSERTAPDALFAAALLSNADGRVSETVDRLQSIPPRARTEDPQRLLAQNQQVLELRRLENAARGNPRSDAARRLLALASRPDPTGEVQAAVIRAFSRLSQTANLDQAVRLATSATEGAPPSARLAVAGAMLEAGRANQAETLAASAERDPALTVDARRQAAAVRNNSTAAAADRLTYDGNRGAALQRLAPALERSPESPEVQLSLARIYASTDRAEEASRITDGLLRQNPRDVAVRSVAGEAAVAQGAYGRAEQLLSEGRALGADPLQMALLDARIARARGDVLRARRALEEAARLRARQLRPVEADVSLSQR
ncbi:tetratricopeptide repeat protein [Roseomonas sp. SSH11]|uniref:Tetratricopeptide repeat protein n=1 Tax=Pararoseomonas baculiformis TaxID=2820812 RepID=A0ABS4AAK1_9PROT|nr:tetratricopeptide repeat protein [Pararoseomonas baculiformis]